MVFVFHRLDNALQLHTCYRKGQELLLYFHVSGSILLLVCLVDQVPLIGKIIQYLSFTTWLISLSIILSSSIYAVAKGRSFFILFPAQYSIVRMYHSFLIHSFTDRHLGCFQHLTIINCAAMSIGCTGSLELVFQDSQSINPAVELSVPNLLF